MRGKSYIGKRFNRIKLYKKGKMWVAASITVFSLGITGTVAHADSLNSSVSTNSTASQKLTKASSKSNLILRASAPSKRENTLSATVKVKPVNTSNSQGSGLKASSSNAQRINSSSSSQDDNNNQKSSATATTVKNSGSLTGSASSHSQESLVQNSSSISSERQVYPKTGSSVNKTKVPQVIGEKGKNALNSLKLPDKEKLLNNQDLVNKLKNMPAIVNRKNDDKNLAALSNKAGDNARGMFDDYENFDHFGSWSIYFQDENGNEIYPVQGYNYAGPNYVQNQITQIVNELIDSGYEYIEMDPNQSLSFDTIDGYYMFVTLIFKELPPQPGGKVTVNYETQDGKLLGSTTASYQTQGGETDPEPHVNDIYTSVIKRFKGYHIAEVPSNAYGTVTASPQTVTYIYQADTETVTINFVDQSDGSSLVKQVHISGAYDTTANFDVNSYVSQHLKGYEVVSSNWPTTGVLLGADSSSQAPYQVVLKHKLTTTTQTKTVTQTINYQYEDGKRALAPKVTKITFTRTVTTDDVTGQQTFGTWQTPSSTTFPSVTAPTIVGYTASPAETSAVVGVNADSSDNVQTIVYQAKQEQITLTFYDMDEGKILQQKTFIGTYGSTPNFDYQSVIQGYEKDGYHVALDTIPSTGLTFTDNNNQNYEVDLTHTYTVLPAGAKNLVNVIKRTIHYVYPDGSTAKPDVVQTVTYTRGAKKDNVTGDIIYTDWSTKDNPDFPAVQSPAISGYTPNQASVPEQAVSQGSSNVIVTVIYEKNPTPQKPQSPTKTTVTETIHYISNTGVTLLPDTVVTKTFTRNNSHSSWTTKDGTTFSAVTAPQITGYTPSMTQIPAVTGITATTGNIVKTIVYTPVQDTITINYVDQTENGEVIHQDTLTGSYGSTADNPSQAEIKKLESEGYQLENNGLPDPTATSFTFTTNQTYTITFVHTYNISQQVQTVTETINYQYNNGTKAANSYTKSLTFTRKQTTDNVTGENTYGPWSPSTGSFPEVTSPEITGYNASQKVVNEIDNVNGSTASIIKTVIYTPIQESVTITYVDDTSNSVITTVTISGGYDTKSDYSTSADISKLESKGYDLVSDGFPSSGIIFGKSKSNYVVHMKDQMVSSENTQTVTETINYVDQNGIPVASAHVSTVTFTQPVVTNKVTGQQTLGSWTPATQTFGPVASPKVTGYTPEKAESDPVTVNAPTATSTSQNITQNITYTLNKEKVEIQFIDQTTGDVLTTEYVTGDYGTRSTYTPMKTMLQYVNEGYKLVSSTFPLGGITFNQDGVVPVYKIVLAHNTRTDTITSNPDNIPTDQLSDSVTETITYTYADSGKQAESPNTQTITFTRSATVDMVTHKVLSYSDWTASQDGFNAVTSPKITGYTANPQVVSAVTNVTADSKNITVGVTYTPNQETATIQYVDQTTNKVLNTVTVNGVYNGTTAYDPTSVIQGYEKQGYVLVKNGVPADGITFTQDGTPQVYTVTLKHNITQDTPSDNPDNIANLSDTVTQTITYIYGLNTGKAGQTAAQTKTNTVTFTRSASYDHVTGQTTYSSWNPETGTFPAVASPEIAGYTPSAASSTAVTVTPMGANNAQTITYNANKESATVQYIDQTDNNSVIKTDTVNGVYGQTVSYDATDEIKKLESEGYQLVSDGVKNDQITLTDGTNQVYQIVLKHATRTDTPTSNPDSLPSDDLQKTVSETINYVYGKDAGSLAGKQAADSVTKTVTFTRSATVDQVTHKVISYGSWTPATGEYPEVSSPEVTGYTPDQSTVAAVDNITPNSSNSTVTVTYHPNQEKFTVQFVDQTENNKVLDTVIETGAYDTTSTYSPESEIESYESQGYVLVSNKYPTGGYTFNQDGMDPVFTITLKHDITQDTPTNNPDGVTGLSSTVNQTINYVFGSNTGKSGQTAAKSKTTSVTFTRNASYDHVTKQTTYGSWTPASSEFPSVTSPTITGYTPSAASSTAVTVEPNDKNNTQTITYNANAESAKIEYIDQTNDNSVIKTDTVDGVFGQTVSYDPTDEIKALEAKGYQLVSDSVKNNQITFTNGTNQVYQIVLKHGTTEETPSSNPDKLDLTKTITRTINYQYQGGAQAAKSVTNSVTFTRTATKDDVTGDITYTPWTSTTTASYPTVTSPKITGYTANQTQVAGATVTADDSDSTVTVTYTPNSETATVTFIDDTTGKQLSTKTLTGAYNTNSSYSPQATITAYEKQGYQLVSDNYPTNGAVFGKDGVIQNYQIHLKEGTETFTPSNPNGLDLKHTVTQTIHYIYSDGKTAEPDATASITFSRTATKDEVTGVITYTPWTNASSTDDFPAVKSPAITGYTPNAAESTPVDNVTESTPDNVQTITYTPNKETATVKYVDQTTGKTLQTVTVNGVYDGTTAYDPTSVIQGYEKKGYVLVNNGVPTSGITFSQDGVTPTYTVTLKHGTTTYTSTNNPNNLDLSNTVTHTIHYVYSTGGQAQPDNTQKITFTRTATKDNVTGTITYSNWGPSSGTFSSVATPTMVGYTASAASSTPVSNVTATSANSSQTITYTPDQESATVTYVDDTTNQTIKTVNLTGAFNSTSSYSTADEISALEKAGYQLVSSNYPDGGVKFDENGEVQHFTVHLKHTYTIETPTSNPDGLDLSNTVTQTIKYVYSNTNKQAASPKVTSITFTRTATKDNVTGKIVGYSNWTTTGSNSFPSVVSPTITGYTPNPTATTAVDNLTGTSPNNVQTVIYSPNKETATVTFVDETTGKTLQTVTLTGAYGTTDSYNPQSVIQQYEAKGYEVASDNYPTNGVNFDEDGVVQKFVIGLIHTTSQSVESKTVTQTINYVYSNGKQAASPKKTSITFTQIATKDQVTGVITYSPWTSATTTFPEVVSPVIPGYTPDKKTVAAVTGVNANTPADNVTVTYTPNQETADVQYIDDTTGQVIKNVPLTGAYNSKSTYDPTSQIQSYEKEGYKLVSNNFPANGEIFNEDGKQQVYQIHLTETTTQYTPSNNPTNLDLTDTVTHTVKYQYQNGTTAADSKIASVTFTRNATKNNVTGAITYTPWTPAISNFPQEVSPTITGYTPSVAKTAAIAVKPGAQNSTQTVVYTPNQEKITVTYIDQTTGKTLKVVTLTGTYGSKANYNPQTQIQTYENQGYELVNNTYPQAGATFNEDGTVANYNIYLKHKDDNNPTGLDLNHTVTETIKYVYSNGKQAASAKTLTLTFHRDATKDDVTGQVTYTAWKPVAGTTFPAVDSPVITGYTPSQKVVSAISNVSEVTPDYTTTVTYTPNQEKATVTFIDDTTDKTITVANLTGAYGTTSNYSPDTTIKKLESEGYELVNDNYPQGGVVFNQDGKVQTFTIHLKHKTTTETATNNPDHLDLSHTITQTIKYQYANGTTASKTHTVQITYTRTATKDDVTGNVTYSDWTTANNDFPAVDSPAIAGYTPSQSVVGPVKVDPTSNDQNIVVTYNANQEKATVVYIDDTTGEVLSTQTLTGAYDSKSNYDIQGQIKNFENHGYQLVSDDYPANGEVFNNPGHVNKYVVHLKHKVTSDSTTSNPDNVADLTKTVSETITYTYANGKTAAQSVTNKVTFTRTATKDQVTGKVTYDAWTPTGNDDFPAVDSPTITGYTPSVAQVGAVNNVAANASNTVKNVVYTPNEEKVTVTFVDETTGKTISVTDLTGPYGSTANYSPTAKIKELESQGYEVVSDDYPQGGAVFNQDGKVKNYTIGLKHRVKTITSDNNPMGLTLSHKITRTIKYQFENGKQAAPSKIETITFGRTGMIDEVTHQITYSPWKAQGSDDFAPVVSPKVRDYTPNIQTISAMDNVAENHPNITQTVTYNLDKEKATVSYIDITTGKVLSTDDLTGDLDSASNYNPQAMIDKYESEGYQFIKSDYPTDGRVFSQDGIVHHYIIQLKEKTMNYTPDNNPKNLDLTKTVTRTINYVDANDKQLAPSVTQTVTFTRNATVNEVTGEVTYSNWQPIGSDSYNAVNSPFIKGYTATPSVVEAQTNVSADTSDQSINVKYTANTVPSKNHSQNGKKASGSQKVSKRLPAKKSANEGTVRVAEQSTAIEKQTPNNSAAQPNESKNTLPQTGEDSANHSLFGGLLIALSGLLGLFGIGKRKKDKEE